jgi:nucleoside-specific outer membrane channel protein Tsx
VGTERRTLARNANQGKDDEMRQANLLATTLVVTLVSAQAIAADWSDTAIGWRYGTRFAEPYGPNNISKHIFNLTHVSGYKYGTNFFNADMLLSDDKDPSAVGSKDGAHEVYVVYRHTLDLGKLSGLDMKFGPVRGVGLTAGFDFNTKTDAGYNSKKRMLVAGPTLMMDVPGFLNMSLFELWESNAPYNGYTGISTPRYRYKTHAMLNLAWGIPLSDSVPLSFEGYANFIAPKGKDEFGGDTKAETNIDMQVMADISSVFSASKNTVRLGLEYQYWKNKFGNDSSGPAGSGAFAKTPMVRAEYHF